MVPFAQLPTDELALNFRGTGEPSSLADPLRRKMATLDPGLPLSAPSTMENLIEEYYPRVMLLGIAAFALVATLLAALGLYGVMSFSIEQRKREIGIRMALGAPQIGVLRLVLAQSLRLALWGIGVGLLGALAVGRVLSGLLFGVKPADPLVLATVSLILLAVALASSYIPARRASQVDPMIPLRCD
jgi:ABC-type lipoprotein release transport system permease subunit